MREPTPIEATLRLARRQFVLGALTVALVVAAVAVLATAFAGPGGVGGFYGFGSATNDEPAPRLVVLGTGQAVAPAETAALQLLLVSAGAYNPGVGATVPGATPGAGEFGWMTPIRDAAISAGALAEDVTVVRSPALAGSVFDSGEGETARLDVWIAHADLDRLNAVVAAVGETADENSMILTQVGASYGLADCASLARQAREVATADARARAIAQAAELGGRVGNLLLAEDIPAALQASGMPADSTGCLVPPDTYSAFEAPNVGASLPAFDPVTPPVAVAVARVGLTFSLDDVS